MYIVHVGGDEYSAEPSSQGLQLQYWLQDTYLPPTTSCTVYMYMYMYTENYLYMYSRLHCI